MINSFEDKGEQHKYTKSARVLLSISSCVSPLPDMNAPPERCCAITVASINTDKCALR